MRLLRLLRGEFRFLLKYGIILLYVLFTVVYLFLLGAIPQSARAAAAVLLVFTDPAAMGLFFMGAVVLLEKSQRVNCSIAVSPVKIAEYIAAKAFTLMAAGTAVSTVLCVYAGLSRIPFVLTGVALSSVLFSLCGLITASRTDTLNAFMITVVPFEIVICVPAILYLFGVIRSDWWLLHPGVSAVRMIGGNTELWYFSLASLVIWSAIAFIFCKRAVTDAFSRMGGGKL